MIEVLRTALVAHAVEQGAGDQDPLRRVAAELTDAGCPWPQRLELVRRVVLPRLPVLLLIDNAEGLLTAAGGGQELADSDLAGFLAAWIQAAPRARLLGTSRYPFTLPSGLQRRLCWHHLGPLSVAETRKLIWRLPALDALKPKDLQRAHAMVGGHPRTLEYLDALLRGGTAAFPDVADRLEAALSERGISDCQQWLAEVRGDLDEALAETITLAADDVLLDSLLTRLDHAPPARELISHVAVFRRPVDDTGIAWQLSDRTAPADPIARFQLVWGSLSAVPQGWTAVSAEDIGPGAATLAPHLPDPAELAHPPVNLTDQGRQALSQLAGLGLVAPAVSDGNRRGWIVHRWTAAALEARTSSAELTAAHRRAAAYWRWRVSAWPQTRAEAVEQLLEARYHHQAAGDLDDALTISVLACSQLRTWGAWTTERQLWEEALSWVPPRSSQAAFIRIQLGVLAHRRGDYPTARRQYDSSLAIAEELGDRAGIANSYHQLGFLAHLRGDYDTAEQHYQASAAIKEEVGDPASRANLAISYHQLGMLALQRGDYRTAEQHTQTALALAKQFADQAGVPRAYQQLGNLAYLCDDYGTAEQHSQALAIAEQLGDRVSLANSYHQLGSLAEHRGDYDTAEQHGQAALAIKEELGDWAGIAYTHHQLGMIAEDRREYDISEQHYQTALAIEEELGDWAAFARTYERLGYLAYLRSDYDAAEQHYQAALAIDEELGDRAGLASSYHHLGMIAQARDDYAAAEQHYQASLAIDEEIGNRADVAHSYHQLGTLAQDRGDYDAAEHHYQAALAIKKERAGGPMPPVPSASSGPCAPSRAESPTPSATSCRAWPSAPNLTCPMPPQPTCTCCASSGPRSVTSNSCASCGRSWRPATLSQ